MTRLAFKIAFVLIAVFGASMLLMRAQPYDDGDLHALFTPPEGCAMPCILGIRAGETPTDEAVALLENHQWVEDVLCTGRPDYGEYPRCRVTWSSDAPDFLDGAILTTGGTATTPEVILVIQIFFKRDYPSGKIYLELGRPTSIGYASILLDGQFVRLETETVYLFGDDMVRISSLGNCPLIYTSAIRQNYGGLWISKRGFVSPGYGGPIPFSAWHQILPNPAC